MNTFGNKFRITLFGESHGPSIGVIMDNIPAGIAISEADFTEDLLRRKPAVCGTTPRREADIPEIISGVYNGHTTGAPLTVIVRNENTVSSDYDKLKNHPRPGHADFAASVKYGGHNDPRGGGQFSGRMTLGLVTAGVVAKKILGSTTIFETRIKEIGGKTTPEEMDRTVQDAVAQGDSVGGIVECRVSGFPAGKGEPFFDSVESVISHLIFSIPAVKGVEFGSGFSSARMKGSENNDPLIDSDGTTSSNNCGGITGGISNGNPLIIKVAVKPTASISVPQHTYNFASDSIEELTVEGRHDACIALRIPVVIEAAVAIALAQF